MKINVVIGLLDFLAMFICTEFSKTKAFRNMPGGKRRALFAKEIRGTQEKGVYDI